MAVPVPQGDGGDVRAGLGGIHARLLVVLHALHGAGNAAVIDRIALCHLLPGGGEAGVDVAGHHGAHGDAEGPQLVGQRHGIGVDGGFRGGVVRLKRDGHRCGHGAEIHDAAMPRRPHQGHHGAVHVDHAEEVHVKELLGVLRGGEFDGAGDAEPGVVHQQVNMAGLGHDLRHGGVDGGLVRHVGGDVPQTLHALRPAGQLVYGAAGLLQRIFRTKKPKRLRLK